MFGAILIMLLATLGVLWLVQGSAKRRGPAATKLATFLTCGALLGLLAAMLLVRGNWIFALPAAAGAIACMLQYQRLARLEKTPTPTSVTTGMSIPEARAILGLNEFATQDDIKAAHRKLIDQLHPDKGGTDYLAAQINAAKDVLLKG